MKKPVHELMGFETDENHEFLVVGAYCWGLGDTIEKAMKKARASGDVSRCYCKIVPINEKLGGSWDICQMTGGLSVKNSDSWNFKEDEVFLQTWDKNFHVGGNSRGKVTKYGFDLFS